MTPLLREVESTPQINDQSRLDQAGDARIDNPAGGVDSHVADDRECAARRLNNQCYSGRTVVNEDLSVTPIPTRNWGYSRKTKGECGAIRRAV